MIQTFANKETEKIWNGIRSNKIPNEIQQICRRKLRMLNNAQTINDMRIPPSNRLKKMKGKFKLYYSCLLYTSPSPRDRTRSRMPSSA